MTNTVYKLIGPVLVKQDMDEAKATVSKRLDYITGEMYVCEEGGFPVWWAGSLPRKDTGWLTG